MNACFVKATEIIKEHEEKLYKFRTCLRAGICPICGSGLELVSEEVTCPKGCALTDINGDHYYNPRQKAYEYCVNNEIRHFYIEHSFL